MPGGKQRIRGEAHARKAWACCTFRGCETERGNPRLQEPTSRGHRERERWSGTPWVAKHAGIWPLEPWAFLGRTHTVTSAPSPVGSCKPRTVYFGHRMYEGRKKGGVEQRTPRSDLCLLGAAFLPSDINQAAIWRSSVLRCWRGDVSGAISGVARGEISVGSTTQSVECGETERLRENRCRYRDHRPC